MNNDQSLRRRGHVWVFGHDVPNDGGVMTIEMTRQIVYDPNILSKHAMAAIDANFPNRAKPGDFVVAGKNFGSGPLHVQGPLGLKGLGVSVLAESTARSFFRLAIAVGLPILPFAKGILEFVSVGDEVDVDFSSGSITNLTSGRKMMFDPLPTELSQIVTLGGEQKWLETQLTGV